MTTPRCAVCDEPLSGRRPTAKYCSARCRRKANRSRFGAGGWAPLDCRWCGATFTPAHWRTRYCCPACAKAGNRAANERSNAKNAKPPARQACAECGAMFTASGTAKYCSVRCKKDAANRKRRAVRSPNARRSMDCARCGVTFELATPSGLYCSPGCKKAALTDVRRRQRHKRRAAQANVETEDFTRLEVFERDGWRCQLCGEMTNPEGEIPQHDAPSLDHVVPLAVGGAHTRANTQCAHFICNVRKKHGTLRPEQLRLIG